ncbi:MAG: complex I subunit 1 family protein [Actinomycetota bacterium]|nr:complex I subunit 1 family protein [Actinomycetota bacterium]
MDPLFADGLDGVDVLIILGKVVVTFLIVLLTVILTVWFERKVISDLQSRVGPNRAGPWGLLQTLADGMKLAFKEDMIPDAADRRVFILAPYLSVVPAIAAFAIVPIGGNWADGGDGTVEIFGRETFLQLADPPIGALFFLAMSGIGVYGVMLAGWSSGSKYPLLGSIRASAQIVSYEAALGLALASVVLVSGTLSTNEMVTFQAGDGFGSFIPNWNLVAVGFIPAVLFVVAGTAELNRPPFDLTEAEQELVGGYLTEYTSMRFAMYYLSEYMAMVTMSALIVTFFLGGPAGPAPVGPVWLWSIGWFALKLVALLYFFVWARASLPRLRYDQLMDFGWKVMIPAALGWFLILATIRVSQDRYEGAGWAVAVGVAMAIALVGYGLLRLSLNAAHRARAKGEEWRPAQIHATPSDGAGS